MKKLLSIITIFTTSLIFAQGANSYQSATSNASGSWAASAGTHSQSTAFQSSSFGNQASATATSATSVGDRTIAKGQASVAVGSLINASGTNAIAIGVGTGNYSQVSGTNAIGIGTNANATNTNSIQIGTGSNNVANSMQIGGTATGQSIDLMVNGSTTANNFGTTGGKVYINGSNGNISTSGAVITNQMISTTGAIQFNGAKLSGVRAGVDGNDAVNVNQLNATKVQTTQDIAQAKSEAIANANLYTDSERDRATNEELKINKRIDALELKMDEGFKNMFRYTYNEFQQVNNRIDGLGASMVALSAAASSQIYNANKPTNLNIGTGVYNRSTAIALSLSHYFNSSTKLSANWAQGTNTNNAIGIGIGFAF